MKTAVRNFSPWSKIHLPLPRTPRQSEQLLTSLTSSFRRELDREHPTSVDNHASNGLPSSVKEHSHSSAHATDQHLRNILENPLFSVTPPRSVASPHDDPRLAKEPMVVFDESVASGSATIHTVGLCLSWQMLLASPHKGEDFVKALKDSRAGSRVVSWWHMSNSSAKMALFRYVKPETRKAPLMAESGKVLVDLTKFMVAEGLHDTILDWLRMLQHSNIGDQRVDHAFAISAFNRLLGSFLKAEILCGGGIESALHYYITASESDTTLDRKQLLTGPGMFLCTSTLRETAKDMISPQLYERYASIMLSVLLPETFNRAVVLLCHPTQPNAKPLVKYMRNAPFEYHGHQGTAQREKHIRACFRALTVLDENKNKKDCLFLAGFLRQLLEEDQGLGATIKPRYHMSSEEKDLLSSLDLAFT
ncbi:hypothetical protein ASPCAL10362 [Aspergillus calidoustus]|uniref:Uncharacterized protein n=1 Tax=Aspergillus calidoustus TaxID=454130 RepID=A0A0U5GBT0_ASPCI|nr:hypothetical protein ASPCAL10362 [Aspergillus calidoustus]